ncbi:MAG: DUF166 family protein [Archaeoglobaceae archaeon]
MAIIQRGYHGRQSAQEISKNYRVITHQLPEELPELMEDVEIPEEIFGAELIISYANHPDINLELVKRATGTVFITGKGGSKSQLLKEAEKNGTTLFVEQICCSVNPDKTNMEFFRYFGWPEFEVWLDADEKKIDDVRVIRTAFCGATHFVAQKLKGVNIDKAPSLAGYYTQIYPCLASRGIKGKIHLAANIHLKAMQRAIDKALSEGGQGVGDDAQQ